ncbi:HDOD domain-containing protein [Pseudorhodoferax sp. Leaf267]|uniref:HDOD domain-containing protein n=1 Tax=Pseudorhodoferax sp. Leaf267 TaxID=1736316 RepID=UPI0007006E6E|nr:HDOD domain-containing protein [Pseudorhodoferax sp. Leaf267]KQP13744.1 histidine kinase [Pseudorhodoferax sp. Leaf267]
MTQSVLGSITLGYRPFWNKLRELAGVQLFIEAAQGGAIDAVHLVAALEELSTMDTPQLLLSMHNRRLLSDMLAHAPAGDYWIEVRNEWLSEPDIAERAQLAHARGVTLVWRGALEDWPNATLQHCFALRLLHLSPQSAVAALQAASAMPGATSPVLGGQLYEGIVSRALAQHCLDQRDALALVGWPEEDVLHAHRHLPVPPDHPLILRVAKAVDADQSMEKIEAIVREEPVLAYRFLSFTNSASMGLRTGIESVRHGLMMLGYSALGRWLADQLPHAATDPDLRPVKTQMVLRARLTEHLLDAGSEDGLRREVYLCGLFAELDSLLHEPLGVALNRLPLSDRIYAATVKRTGPYAPALQVSRALEGDDTKTLRTVCRSHGMAVEEVNRQLLRTLVAARR